MTERFVHVWLATVESQAADEVVDHLRETIRQALSALHGIKSASILLSDVRTRVAVITEWEGPHDWGRAQWDAHVQEAIVALFRSAKHVDSHVYREVFHYPT